MNQNLIAVAIALMLVAFGYYYVSNDLGGNAHFDKAGENWKRK